MGIDEKLKQLDEYVLKMEDENISVEEAMQIFEKASVLSKECYEELTQVKGKIYLVSKEMDEFKEKLTTKELK